MQRALITGILGLAVVVLMSVAVATAIWPENAIAAGLHGLHGDFHGDGHGRHGGARHCAQLDDKHVALLEAWVDIELELTDAQSAAFAPVVAVVSDWQHATRSTCDNLDTSTASAALVSLETLVTQAQTAVVQLRPAFEGFYATLDAEQQATVDGWLAHHHGGAS